MKASLSRPVLVENSENKQRIYDSLLLEAKHLGIFSNELAVKMINELAKQPLCAMDIAKNLKENEQKIYYHLRKMISAGIVKLNGTESRYGMTAKMYELVSPVIATKLYDGGYDVKPSRTISNPQLKQFFSPFVADGRLNCRIVVGDSYPHGKYDAPATEGPYLFDFAFIIGKLIEEMTFPHYSLDTDKIYLKSNLILLGNARTNVVVDKFNSQLPAYFDLLRENRITVKGSGNSYSDPRIGVIIRTTNPLNKNKKILLLGGVRTRGMQAAVIALTQHFDELVKGMDEKGNLIRVVEGYDSSGDKRIDAIKFLE